MSKKLRGDLMLFTAALIWGASFVAQKAGMEYIGPFTFNVLRFLLGSAVLIPVIFLMDRLKKQNGESETAEGALTSGTPQIETGLEVKKDKKTLIAGGLSCGIALFIGGTLQQFGVMYTSAGKAGFITALYIVLVPLFGLFFRHKVRPVIWVCVVLAVIGLYLLCVKEGFSIAKGDLLVLACAFGFASHILIIDHFSPKTDGVRLSCLQFLTAGLLSLPGMLLFETVDWGNIVACAEPILYSAVLSCGAAYTLQILGQRDTEPAVASLLLSLESVFAVIAGIIILKEHISPRELLGCCIMFAAIILAQLPEKKEKPSAGEKKDPVEAQNNFIA
ncbi:MAG TPA: DMT family transporter [Bacillota bacterium]|nr:DMT family transporter [Bacillota bacterium]